ncbi:MAG TPA: hypothetical protein VGF84_19975 [Micromonosporaceae bacterium]
MTVVIVGTAIVMCIGLHDRGFIKAAAPICGALPLLAFVYFACFWPKVVVAEELTVQNSYTTYRIPYQDIKELVSARIGLFVMLHANQKIPVTAYVSGSTGKMFGHEKMLAEVVGAIEEKLAAVPATKDQDQAVVRTVHTGNIVTTIISVVLAVGFIWAAIAT